MKREIEGRKKWRRGERRRRREKRWKKGEEKAEKRKGGRREKRKQRRGKVEGGRRESRGEERGGRREKTHYAYSWYKVAAVHVSIIKPLPLPLRQLVSGMIMYSSSSTHRILLKSLSRLLKGEVEVMVGDVWNEGWGAIFC